MSSWSEIIDNQFARKKAEEEALADKIYTLWPEFKENLLKWTAEELFTYYENIPVVHFWMADKLGKAWGEVRQATRDEIIRRMERQDG